MLVIINIIVISLDNWFNSGIIIQRLKKMWMTELCTGHVDVFGAGHRH